MSDQLPPSEPPPEESPVSPSSPEPRPGEQQPPEEARAEESPRSLLPLAVVVEGGLGLLAVALGWLLKCPPRDAIDWTWEAAGWGAAAAVPMLGVLAALICIPWKPFVQLVRIVDELIVPIFRPARLIDLVMISGLAGLGEELLFRGVIQRALELWLGGGWGPWTALAIAAVLFGLGHSLTPTYAVLATLIGLYLGWLWILTGNLLIPITAHAVYDLVAILYLVRVRAPRMRRECPRL